MPAKIGATLDLLALIACIGLCATGYWALGAVLFLALVVLR